MKKDYNYNASFIYLIIVDYLSLKILYGFMPFDEDENKLILCVVGIFLYSFIEKIWVNVKISNKDITDMEANIDVALLLLLIPMIISFVYDSNKVEILTGIPEDKKIRTQITTYVSCLEEVGSIGHDLSYEHKLNGRILKSGDIVEIGFNTPFTIKTKIVEEDGSISDVGEKTSAEYVYSKNNRYRKDFVISYTVRVDEVGGRKYAGSYADFKVEHKLTRVLPKGYSILDVFFYSNGIEDILIEIGLVLLEIACIVRIRNIGKEAILVQENDIKDEEKRIEQEKILRQQEFIKSLRGMTLYRAAGVPEGIRFVDGLPTDSKDGTYGNFSVYYSPYGSCYHVKKGCCHANMTGHILILKDRYRPCSKCCPNLKVDLPWYKKYNELEYEAKYLGLDVDELNKEK